MTLRQYRLRGGTAFKRGCVHFSFRLFQLIAVLRLRGIGLITSLLPRSVRVDVPLEEIGGVFSFAAGDNYWSKTVLPERRYEPEVLSYLSRYEGQKVLFIDCGANNGYWTIYAGKKFGSGSRVLSVEANPAKFEELRANVEANNIEAMLVNRAISDINGQSVSLDLSRGHAAASIVAGNENGKSVTVETVTIDSLLEQAGFSGESSYDAVIVKLDVEGAEVMAINGGSKLEDMTNHEFLYEDHGNDPEHATSRFLVSQGYAILFLGDEVQAPMEIDDCSQIDALKRDPLKGYNFVAARA